MNLYTLEICANKFLEMCQNHPELCPHDYHWDGSIKDCAGNVVEIYVCGLCGNIETITKIIEE